MVEQGGQNDNSWSICILECRRHEGFDRSRLSIWGDRQERESMNDHEKSIQDEHQSTKPVFTFQRTDKTLVVHQHLSSKGLKVDKFLVRLIIVMSTRLSDLPCLFATQHKILIICVLGVQKVCISLVMQVQCTLTGSSAKHNFNLLHRYVTNKCLYAE